MSSGNVTQPSKVAICCTRCPIKQSNSAEDIHCLPISTSYAGKAAASTYFVPHRKQSSADLSANASTINPNVAGESYRASFRGFELYGKRVELEAEHQVIGTVLVKEHSSVIEEVLECQLEQIWAVDTVFDSFVDWQTNPHKPMTSGISNGLEWMDIAQSVSLLVCCWLLWIKLSNHHSINRRFMRLTK